MINSKQYSTHLLFFLFLKRNSNSCLWCQNNKQLPVYSRKSENWSSNPLLWIVSTFLYQQLLFWPPSYPHASSYLFLLFSIQVFCCRATYKCSSVMSSNLSFFEIISDFLSCALWFINWIERNLNLFSSNWVLVCLFDQVCFNVFWTSD